MSTWAPFSDHVTARGVGSAGLSRADWQEEGTFPVIGQGSAFVEGRSSRVDLVIEPPSRGLIVYGGHTRRAKFVDMPFIPGPNIRILITKPTIFAKFLAHFLIFNPVAEKGYADHFPELRRSRIPVPSLEEQQRIVGLLDRAAEVRRRADAACAKARAIIPALFLDMFGDPGTNPKGWPVTTVGELAKVELRNGISPSKAGAVTGKVLTLSAVTRGAFDPAACKESLFAAPLAPEQSVSRSSFLICRGNGNPELVGRGAFPTADMPDTAFPDTIIALRGILSELTPAYLLALWATDFMRGQIKAAAKTTNGTYKISQGSILSFVVPLPPLPLQSAFAEQAQRLEVTTRALEAVAAKAEAMAAALSAEVFGRDEGQTV